MNNALIMIVNAITLVYFSRATNIKLTDSLNLANRVLKEARLPRSILGESIDTQINDGLKDTLAWLVELDHDICPHPTDIITRIKMITGLDNNYEDILTSSLAYEEETIDTRMVALSAQIVRDLSTQHLEDVIKKASREFNKDASGSERPKLVNELLENLSDIKNKMHATGPSSEGQLKSDDLDTITNYIRKAKEDISTEGLLKTGLRGINEGFGIGGMVRGGLYNIAGRSFNYKTGLLLDMYRWIPMYNIPHMWDKKKKPLILRISFENRIEQDIPKLYRDIKALEGEDVDIRNFTSEEEYRTAAKYIVDVLGRNGYHFEMEFYSPLNFTTEDIHAIIDKHEKNGYEIHMINIDYPEMYAKYDTSVRNDMSITNAYDKIRAYTFPRGITVVAAHQLSTEAETLSRQLKTAFIKEVSTGGWYHNARSLVQKVDGELFVNKVEEGGKTYLTFGHGKHRASPNTPSSKKFYAYEMHPMGTLHDDVLKPKSDAIYNLSRLGLDADEPDREDTMELL